MKRQRKKKKERATGCPSPIHRLVLIHELKNYIIFDYFWQKKKNIIVQSLDCPTWSQKKNEKDPIQPNPLAANFLSRAIPRFPSTTISYPLKSPSLEKTAP